MGRKLLTVALACAALFAAAMLPASADTVTASGPTEPGGLVEVLCPEGQRFVSGTATLYRREGHPKPLATVALEPNAGGVGGYTVAPKGAHWYTAAITCQPTSQDVTYTGTFQAGQALNLYCPPETPYLWSVLQVDAIDPSTGQHLGLGYSVLTDDSGGHIGISVYPTYGPWPYEIILRCQTARHPA